MGESLIILPNLKIQIHVLGNNLRQLEVMQQASTKPDNGGLYQDSNTMTGR
jgi:hypothetical protein